MESFVRALIGTTAAVVFLLTGGATLLFQLLLAGVVFWMIFYHEVNDFVNSKRNP